MDTTSLYILHYYSIWKNTTQYSLTFNAFRAAIVTRDLSKWFVKYGNFYFEGCFIDIFCKPKTLLLMVRRTKIVENRSLKQCHCDSSFTTSRSSRGLFCQPPLRVFVVLIFNKSFHFRFFPNFVFYFSISFSISFRNWRRKKLL